MLEILKLIAAILTIATGALSLFAPKSTPGFTGLEPIGGRGISEIRSILGGLFITLGLYPILAASADGYTMLGWAYLGIACGYFLGHRFCADSLVCQSLIARNLFEHFILRNSHVCLAKLATDRPGNNLGNAP